MYGFLGKMTETMTVLQVDLYQQQNNIQSCSEIAQGKSPNNSRLCMQNLTFTLTLVPF